MNKVVYQNLGACAGPHMLYLRSTDIEQMNWERLLLSFPDEALYHMTLGRLIVVEDRCSKPRGKIQRIFAPVFSDFLRWLLGKPVRHPRLGAHLAAAQRAYRENKVVHSRYHFFRDKLRSCHVRGRTIHCRREPSVWRQAPAAGGT